MTPTPKQIEAAAIAIHAYGDEGTWDACANKDFWRGYAEEALTAALSQNSAEAEPVAWELLNTITGKCEILRDLQEFERRKRLPKIWTVRALIYASKPSEEVKT